MKTAIIQLNYNNSDEVIRYTNELKEYSVIDKIIVVDNMSLDDSYKKLLKLKCEKIDVVSSEKNGGYSYGNNFGVKYLEKNYPDERYDFIIISNSDVYVGEAAIKKCLSIFEQDDKAVVAAPRMNYINGPARRSAWRIRTFLRDVVNSTRLTELLLFPIFRSGEYSKEDYQNGILEVECISGSFFITRHDVFKDIGYFDENTFLFYEEDIIGSKLKAKGYKTYSVNTVNFIHYESQTIGKLFSVFKKQKILFESRKYFHKTYNNANTMQLFIFDLLYVVRLIELFVEIPILKVVHVLKRHKI